MDERRRLTGFVLARILLVTLLLVATLILKIQSPASIEGWSFSRFLLLLTGAYIFSLMSLVVSWLNERLVHLLAYLQIIWDILFVTALLVVTGGIASPFPFLYLLSVISASLLLARREAIYTASLCGILYGALLDFQYYGLLTPLGLSQEEAGGYGAAYVFYTIFVTIAAFYLAAGFTGYLAEKARRSEHDLEEKTIDFDELTRLHTTIVTNMESGLMTLDRERRIKVFNACAELLTGMQESEVYGLRLEEVFPEFIPVVDTLRGKSEMVFSSGRRAPLVLSCSATPLADREGREVGIIVTFQDVTDLKQMEAELKRADRLAAVGELSARIAHEVRNPLASISGAVQLIAQNCELHGDERQLLDIVVRESDRLNALLSDFLAYARPHPPQRVLVPLRRIIDDLRTLICADRRFERIVIRQEFSEEASVQVDVDQITQVLWNLFTNAADAMPEGGEITVGMVEVKGSDTKGDEAVWDEIMISDTGTGMSIQELSGIFEPFFTTKRNGSGLGLAMVYRIVEAHSGQVRVESSPGTGTRMFITLPHERKSDASTESTLRQAIDGKHRVS